MKTKSQDRPSSKRPASDGLFLASYNSMRWK